MLIVLVVYLLKISVAISLQSNYEINDFTYSNDESSCNKVEITATNGFLQSPLNNDGKNYSCEWTIRLPSNYGLNIFFNKLKINSNCKNENIRILDAMDNVVFDTCNLTIKLEHQNFPFLIDISSNIVRIEYERTQVDSFDDGFSLIFHTWRKPTLKSDCDENEFKCLALDRCIPIEFRCDCLNDCKNEDESHCAISKNKCSPQECNLTTHFTCKTQQTKKVECISNDLKCNQIIDCEDGSDEDNCQSQDCSFIYPLTDYGTLSSPLYPLGYANNLNCSYFIIMQPHKTIQLRFKSLTLRKGIYRLQSNDTRKQFSERERFLSAFDYDYDFISIYDGDSIYSPLLMHITAVNNNLHSLPKTLNSRSNKLLILFHSKPVTSVFDSPLYGFNLTYQSKGYCIDDQLSCNFDPSYRPIQFEQNCFDRNQTCDDTWDCRNGADERYCGNCGDTQFRCRNPNFCYNYEDRCDGDYQCTDKSDELNCDSWFCNSQNGTFLCANRRCIYEQWVCDGTNDCEDGSDEVNCPTPFTRRVITTAVLGGTLCCLLLVMALGCACKLYALRTAEYRTNLRLSSTSNSHQRRRRRQRRSFSLFNFMRRGHTREANTNNNDSNLHRSASTSSLPSPHSIAPPSYNQTMGLVDEYEQRQLAFIEHVRSIITSNNNTNATSASSTINRVSSSSRRRSHSTRQRTDANSTSRRERRNRHNRTRIILPPNQQIQTIINETQSTPNQQQVSLNESSATTPSQAQTSAPNNGSTQNLTKVTNGLKNRITKLLNNIVNHGDNIQYVQLTDTRLSQQQQQQQQSSTTSPINPSNQHEQNKLENKNNNSNDDSSLIDS